MKSPKSKRQSAKSRQSSQQNPRSSLNVRPPDKPVGETFNSKKSKGRKSKAESEPKKPNQEVDGEWGWFVVFNSFICNLVVDGMQYTFANFLIPISITFGDSLTAVSLIGSLLSGFYNFSGPIGGALGNKFGFRMVIITGTLVACSGLMLSYFAPRIEFLYILYGVLGGLGFGMIYMSSVITTSMYFEKYRALAASLSVCGTGIGTFVFSPLGNYLVVSWGWRMALVCEGGMTLVCILCGLSFRPLKIIAVVPIAKSETSVTSSISELEKHSGSKKNLLNENFPTLKEALLQGSQIETRRSTMVSLLPMNQKQSLVSIQIEDEHLPIFSVVTSKEKLLPPKPKKHKKLRKCCRVCCFNFWHCRCHHQDLALGERPMYRDDIFYEGSLAELQYSSSERIKYHLSVTRVPGLEEVQQHVRQECCVCHHAFVRALNTMLGLHLFKSIVFIFLCVSSFLYTMAMFIPYVFIRKLAEEKHMSAELSIWLVASLGITNTCGRLFSGIVKSFFNVRTTFLVFGCLLVSGISCFIFLMNQGDPIFFIFCCIFGFFTAPFISLRPVVIVEFLGLEKLTNAFGLVLWSQGIASIMGPPLAGLLDELTDDSVYIIYFAGSLMIFSTASFLVSTLIAMKKKS